LNSLSVDWKTGFDWLLTNKFENGVGCCGNLIGGTFSEAEGLNGILEIWSWLGIAT
jgi:hypothetical protein